MHVLQDSKQLGRTFFQVPGHNIAAEHGQTPAERSQSSMEENGRAGGVGGSTTLSFPRLDWQIALKQSTNERSIMRAREVAIDKSPDRTETKSRVSSSRRRTMTSLEDCPSKLETTREPRGLKPKILSAEFGSEATTRLPVRRTLIQISEGSISTMKEDWGGFFATRSTRQRHSQPPLSKRAGQPTLVSRQRTALSCLSIFEESPTASVSFRLLE